MLRFLSLSSGSAGNSYFLSDGNSGLLIDTGVSVLRMKRTMKAHGLSLDSFQAILLTHNHMDHVRHLCAYSKRLPKPVYATEVLHKAIAAHPMLKDFNAACKRYLPENEPYRLILDPAASEETQPLVTHFIVPHDASQTVGFFIEWAGSKFFLMTDAGRVTDEALEYASKADSVVFESNYDPQMLIAGPYPHELKMRICQGNGHLSNDECAEAVKRFWHPGLRNIFLCHLSENNNTPELAFKAVSEVLRSIPAGGGLSAKEVTNLQVLPRTSPSVMFTL